MIRFTLLFIIIPYIFCAQIVTESTIIYDGIERSYILYVPELYNENTSTPLVLNLHGYGSNSGQQMIYSNFYEISNTENFILVHPLGTIDATGSNFWSITPSDGVDDVGFLNALIDSMSNQYNINENRIYSLGMSNGGFMSYYLACELNNKIAAIASVTGSMTSEQMNLCNPLNPIPVMQIHGTSDFIVPYNGLLNLGTESIDNIISYWVDINQCDMDPIINDIENTNLLDLSEVEHYIYENGINNNSVEFYKIINGGHTWPGATIPFAGNNTNQDINASEVIWDFFKKYDKNGIINQTQIKEINKQKKLIKSIDILGQKTKDTHIYFNIYDDGSVKKLYQINKI